MVLDSCGISIFETMVLQGLGEVASSVKSIYIIGNAWGWSAVIFNQIFPFARIVTLDALIGGEIAKQTHLNFLALTKKHNLPIKSFIGFSPKDVPSTIEASGMEKIDLVFIDGDHTNEQIVKDFYALKPYTDDDSIFIFHDVLSWRLEAGFNEIVKNSNNLHHKLLHRTTSGIGVLYKNHDALDKYLEYFEESRLEIESITNRQVTMKTLWWRFRDTLQKFLPHRVYSTTHLFYRIAKRLFRIGTH